MKALYVFALLAVTTHAQAAVRVVGKFEAPKKIANLTFTKEECQEAQGEWTAEEGALGTCVVDSFDSVEVKLVRGEGRVLLSTIGTNGHMCDYEGKAVRLSEKVVIASTPSEIFVPGENGQPDQFKKGVCKVRLTYADSNHVKVEQTSSYEACRFFCGMNAVLEIDGAVRK